jgi:NADPH2:quinone reductase
MGKSPAEKGKRMKAILVHEVGGPEKMQLADVPVPEPRAGHALVKLAAIGVNFIDIYHRTGLYPLPTPIAIGMEGAGTIESVGPGVTDLAPGDRVAYAMARGSYAEYHEVPARQLVKLPESVEFNTGAAAMLQGMTAHYLTHSTFPLEAGQTALIHAAAGGAGQLTVQMAKLRGAKVIGTVGSEAKVSIARKAGADEVINYSQQDFEAEVKRITDNKGVDVVYDSVGAATFAKSINSLRPRGMMVSFGNASGPVPDVSPLLLGNKGSLYLTRPSLAAYTATREELIWRANDVLNWLGSGKLKLNIEKAYPLAEAAQAHIDLESRKTTGKLLLIP